MSLLLCFICKSNIRLGIKSEVNVCIFQFDMPYEHILACSGKPQVNKVKYIQVPGVNNVIMPAQFSRLLKSIEKEIAWLLQHVSQLVAHVGVAFYDSYPWQCNCTCI